MVGNLSTAERNYSLLREIFYLISHWLKEAWSSEHMALDFDFWKLDQPRNFSVLLCTDKTLKSDETLLNSQVSRCCTQHIFLSQNQGKHFYCTFWLTFFFFFFLSILFKCHVPSEFRWSTLFFIIRKLHAFLQKIVWFLIQHFLSLRLSPKASTNYVWFNP